jgi:Flp pilus assembly protein TadG
MKKTTGKLFGIARARRGATAVEFALIAPVAIMFIMGTIELGRFFYTRATMQYVCDDTGRWAMMNTSANAAAIKSQADAKASTLGPASQATYSAVIDAGTPNFARIEATYAFDFMIPFVNFSNITISTKSRVPLL